jgi:multidrug efflux pump subunit AcrB
MLFVLFAVCGLALIPRLTVKLNPGRESKSLTVSFVYPGAAPQVVEHEVTSELEGTLATMNGVRQIESNSSFGYGSIIIETEEESNIETLRFQILSVIKDVWQHLPQQVGYPEINSGRDKKSNKELLVSYTLTGNASSHKLREYADNSIKRAFSRIKSVSGIETYGATPYEWKFTYNHELLNQYGISPNDLALSLNQWQQKTGVGVSGDNITTKGLHATPVVISYSDETDLINSWKDIPVRIIGNKIVRFGEVAQLEITEQQPLNYFRINGKNTVSINIYAAQNSNQLALAKDVEKAEHDIQVSLPDGWQLIQMYNSSDYLHKEIDKTALRLIAALMLLFLFILLVQRSWKYMLFIIISLAINISIACIFYYLFHVEIHLVSIAGITVSIGIIIGNYVIMADYLLERKSLRIYMPLLGATLTTLGALVVVFFLDDHDQVNLIDFAMVTIINLSVSLLITLFFIPSLLTGLSIRQSEKLRSHRRVKRIAVFSSLYGAYIKFAHHWRYTIIVLLIFIFGLPTYLLPFSIEKKTTFAKVYNSTLGSNFYREHLRMPIEKTTGGILRLFMQHVSDGNGSYQPSGETTLYMRVSLPTGTTIVQLNEVCLRMENYLGRFEGIRQFQSYVNSPQDASIIVYFEKETQNSALPAEVKSFLIQKANEFAGADFGIYMRNESFSNELTEGWRSSQVQISGFDYRQLVSLAHEFSDTLSHNPRIRDIAIFSGNDAFLQTATLDEKGLLINKSMLANAGIQYNEYVASMQKYHTGATAHTMITSDRSYTPVSFFASDLSTFDFWQFMHTAIGNDSIKLRPEEASKLTTMRVDGNIYKKNQSYMIRLAYNFIGPDELAKRALVRETNKFKGRLPLGFKAEIPKYDYSWMFGSKPIQYWLIALVIVIIWAISAILFESLSQPFVVICIVPISFIGALFTFYYFEIPFDVGGYASLILLSGLSANMVIYILNDLNQIRKYDKHNPLKNYVKAFNSKIAPLLLTILSIAAGLLPFLLFDTFTSFWTAFAAGTIGGLLLLVPLIVLFLPVILKMDLKNKEENSFTNKPIKL